MSIFFNYVFQTWIKREDEFIKVNIFLQSLTLWTFKRPCCRSPGSPALHQWYIVFKYCAIKWNIDRIVTGQINHSTLSLFTGYWWHCKGLSLVTLNVTDQSFSTHVNINVFLGESTTDLQAFCSLSCVTGLFFIFLS
jgi:hypothetical protein